MKARVDFFCKPAKKTTKHWCENIFIEVDLPFLPPVGTMIKVTPDGDYYEVDNVYLDLSPGGEGLMIGLKQPPKDDVDLRPWPEMKAQGWKILE